MSFPSYPNPARRAKILQAHQLRQQGLTLRQIAEIMDCAHSTVAGYLADFEHFRADLMHELAADQIVCHVIQLADLQDERHDQRLATVRELRLLLGSVAQIRRDEDDRTRELTQAGVAVDRYGNRHAMPNRFYPATPEELAQLEQPAQPPIQTELDPDQPLALVPTVPSVPDLIGSPPDSPVPDLIGDPLGSPAPERGPATTRDITAEPARTNPNKPEQESTPNPAQDGKSANRDQNSSPPTEHPQPSAVPDDIRRELERSTRDWINDYPQHNPNHPLRQAALQLKAEAEAAARQPTQPPAA